MPPRKSPVKSRQHPEQGTPSPTLTNIPSSTVINNPLCSYATLLAKDVEIERTKYLRKVSLCITYHAIWTLYAILYLDPIVQTSRKKTSETIKSIDFKKVQIQLFCLINGKRGAEKTIDKFLYKSTDRKKSLKSLTKLITKPSHRNLILFNKLVSNCIPSDAFPELLQQNSIANTRQAIQHLDKDSWPHWFAEENLENQNKHNVVLGKMLTFLRKPSNFRRLSTKP